MGRLELYSAGVLHCQAHAHSFSEGGGVDGVHIYSWEVAFPLGQCEDMTA